VIPTVYLITTCFPPDVGGIEQYCHGLVRELTPDSVTVSAPDRPGAAEFDRHQPFRIIRHRPLASPAWRRRLVPYSRQAVYVPSYLGEPVSDNRGLLDIRPPKAERATTRAALRSVLRVVDDVRPGVVCLSSAFPLGYLAAGLTAARDLSCVSFTHGIEASVARLPIDRFTLRHVANNVDVLAAVCQWTGDRIGRAVGGRAPVELIYIGVDTEMFHPATDGSTIRARHGLGNVPVCLCVGRLVPRKGQDQLIRAWPRVLRDVPDAHLVIVGPGPDEQRLRRLVTRSPCADRVLVTGEVPRGDVPLYFAAADVFAMPSRSRLGGLDIEGLGTVYLEAAAAGLPVVVGRSGGAPDSVVDGVTGLTVDGRSTTEIASAIAALLGNPERSRAMGKAGRRRVESEYTSAHSARQLMEIMQRLVEK
jgi:phosphatidylinositol alpha-1,6-mannosyltransferase